MYREPFSAVNQGLKRALSLAVGLSIDGSAKSDESDLFVRYVLTRLLPPRDLPAFIQDLSHVPPKAALVIQNINAVVCMRAVAGLSAKVDAFQAMCGQGQGKVKAAMEVRNQYAWSHITTSALDLSFKYVFLFQVNKVKGVPTPPPLRPPIDWSRVEQESLRVEQEEEDIRLGRR